MKKIAGLFVLLMLCGVVANAEEVKNSVPALPDYTSRQFTRIDTHVEYSGVSEHGNRRTIIVETYSDTKNEASATNKIKVYYSLNHTLSSVGKRPFGGEFYPIHAEWVSYADKKARTYRFGSRVFDEDWYLVEENDLPNK